MLLNVNKNDIFFFLRETFCGLEYGENTFAALTGGTHDALPKPPSRLGEDTPSKSSPH